MLSSSFEDYNNGSVFGQDNWQEDNDNDGSAEIVIDPSYVRTGSKALRLYSSSALETVVDHQSFGKDESGISSNVYLDFWLKIMTHPSEDFYIRVFDHLPDNGIRRASEIRMYPNGDIKVSDGGSKRDVPTSLYTQGDWMRISLAVDYATFKYQAAINGTVITNTTSGDEFFNFRESYDPVDKGRPSGIKEYHGLRFWYEAALGDIAIDDIYIGTDPIDDISFIPTSLDRTITIEQPDKATITLNPDQPIYQVGDVVTATLSNVATHYKFNGWTGSYSSTDNPLTINVAGNVNLGADLIIDPTDPPNEYNITITQPEGGTISIDPTSGPYYEGTTVEFEIVADIGYEFESWTGIQGDGPQVEVVVTENLDVSANMSLGSFSKRTIHVSSNSELEDALEAILPGDSIVLANGTYNEFSETLEFLGGTAEYPVYVIAANQGMAKFTGKSKFTLENCAYITFQGLDMNVSDVNNIFKLVDCNNIRITRNRITSSKSESSSKWIEIGGEWNALETFSHHNRVDHNLFEKKQDGGALLIIGGNSGNNGVADISKFDLIDHNHFRNIGPRVSNEKETIRVGYSKLSLESAYTTIEYNLFEECDGDPEIISVKSCDNYIRNNTFSRSLGTVSLRHGNRVEVSGNYFIGDGKTAEFEGGTIGCGGVRIYGKDHKVFNNYFEGLTGFRWDAALTLTGGDASNDNVDLSDDLTKHYRVENLEFTHNTLVNNFSDIEIGYRDDWSLDPKNILVANNVITQDENPVTTVYDNRDGGVSFADNIIHTTGTGSWGDITFTTTEAKNEDPLLALTNCLIPAVDCDAAYPNAIYKISGITSPAYDPSPVHSFPEVINDLEGQPAVGVRDLGADEYNGTDPILNGLLDARHVGPDAEPFSESEIILPERFTVSLIQSEGGSIAVTPSGPYDPGTTITFTATADDGYQFVAWDGIDATEAISEVVINDNLNVKAEFSISTAILDNSMTLKAYPNPFRKQITLESTMPASVLILSVEGIVIDAFNLNENKGWSAPAPGMYFVQVQTAQEKQIIRIFATQ